MTTKDINFTKFKIILGVIFLILSIGTYLVLDYLSTKNKTEHLQEVAHTYERSYKTVYKQYEELSYFIYSGFSRMSDIRNQLEKLKHASADERQEIQDEIYFSTVKRFRDLSKKHLRNINFIDKDKTILVKLKNTKQNNYKISHLRNTIHNVFEKKKIVGSFEVGKNGAGFRFVYPVLNDYDEVLGALDITFGAEAITSGIMSQYYVLSNFFISNKKFNNNSIINKKNFVKSIHDDFLFDKRVLKELKKVSRVDIAKLKPSKHTVNTVVKNGAQGNTTSYYDNDLKLIFTTVPVLNGISKELEGILIVRSNGSIIDTSNDYFNVLFGLFLLIYTALLLFLYQDYTKRLMMKSTIKVQEELLELHAQKERELKLEKDRFQLAIDGTKDGLWDWKIDSNFIYFSPQYKAMIGYADNELENNYDAWYSRIHPDDLEKTMTAIEAHLEGKTTVYENEYRFEHKNGSWIWILSRGKALFSSDGKAVRMIGFHTDLTKRKELERKMINAEKMSSLGEMIGNIAHQWRQPLSVISTTSSGMMLQKEIGALNDDNFIRNCKTITEQTESLSQTIEDFRDYIKGDMKLEYINLSDVIKQVLNIEKAILSNNEIIGIYDFDDNLKFYTFPNAIVQAMINIVNNAKDALGELETDRYLFISTIDCDDHIKIVVKDNAGGIPEDIINKIYEAYFTTKHKYQGTGLGLHMTYNLITTQLQGKIENSNITYEYNGKEYKGAEFIITLPKKIIEKKENE